MLHLEFDRIDGYFSLLPEVAKMDLSPRMKRLDTMIHALERDVEEVSMPAGASLETAEHLHQTIETELSNLNHEVEFLSMGNPTTITAALDASMHAADKIGSTIRKCTAFIYPHPKKSD
tara:strand:+ start:455 stop:811 length:357 start_codon:yes stop_codon:yes gene_type:complete